MPDILCHDGLLSCNTKLEGEQGQHRQRPSPSEEGLLERRQEREGGGGRASQRLNRGGGGGGGVGVDGCPWEMRAYRLIFARGDFLQELWHTLAGGQMEAHAVEKRHAALPMPMVYDVPCMEKQYTIQVAAAQDCLIRLTTDQHAV